MSSPSLKPQSTGSNLGSRNPFLGLLTPQSTGAVNTSSISMPEPVASTSASAAHNQTVDPPAVPPKDTRATSPPLPDRKSLERRPTGALNSGDRDVDELTTSLSASRPFSPPALPPRAPETTVTSPDNHTAPARNSTLDFIQEDLPPEYTPGPNALQGEQSVDFGPVRPFQNEQIRPPRQPVMGQQPSSSYFTPPPGGPNLSRGGSGGSGSLGRALGGLLLEILSERDRGSILTSNRRGAPGLIGRAFPSEPYGRSMPSQSTPSMPSQASRGWSEYPGQPGRSRTPEPRERPPNDGKPTARPIPGHPLLRDNKVLIYPLGHECRKCFNKGFRPLHASTFDALPRPLAPGDPSHPCKKCWQRYAQPYTSILSQLDWTTSVETNFQRPISDPDVVSPPSVMNPSRARTLTRPRSTTPPPPVRSQFTGGMPGGWVETSRSSYNGAMSPGSGVIYEPGDPRIGGRLCVRCQGTGRIRVFILETETCNLCGGVGRVF